MTATAALVTRARALYALAWCGKSPALLAHIRAQDAELARLRDALAAVCEACTKIATFEPGGELSFDRWDRGHRAGWRMAGKIAKQALEDTTAARALLDLGNGD